MRLGGFIILLFVFYCITAGLLLIFAPWGPLWQRILVLVPDVTNPFFTHPTARAAVSGFGLVHLVWALNDLESLFVLANPYGTDDVS